MIFPAAVFVECTNTHISLSLPLFTYSHSHPISTNPLYFLDKIDGIEEIVNDPILAKSIFAASQSSMGTDISAIDLLNISSFADRVISLTAYRKNLFNYLCSKMSVVAPNLCALIGEMVGARLIAHAGSLTNLAKYPASTVQILGAEKALFR